MAQPTPPLGEPQRVDRAERTRQRVLDALEPDPVALVHPLDLAALGVNPGDLITIESPLGHVGPLCIASVADRVEEDFSGDPAEILPADEVAEPLLVAASEFSPVASKRHLPTGLPDSMPIPCSLVAGTRVGSPASCCVTPMETTTKKASDCQTGDKVCAGLATNSSARSFCHRA